MLSKKVFLKQIAILSELYGDITDARANITYKAICDIENETFKAGIINLIQNREYANFPRPAEIRRYCIGDSQENLEAKIEKAKLELQKGIQNGAYRSIEFQDKVIHSIVEHKFGSWAKACQSQRKDFDNFLKFEFEKLYRVLADNCSHSDYLKGIAEIRNQGNGKILHIRNRSDYTSLKVIAGIDYAR